MIKISPSVLACDFAHMADDVKRVEDAGVEYLHLDVMDGMFVPNLSFGAPVIRAIRPYSTADFDVHLMINDPLRYIDDFVAAGADLITIHEESCTNVEETLRYIRSKGVKASLSIKPKTNPERLRPYLPFLDMILIMSVEPGFGGQGFIYETLENMRAARKMLDECGSKAELEVDGGVTVETAPLCVAAGCDVLVAGSAVYKKPDIAEAIADIREAGESALL